MLTKFYKKSAHGELPKNQIIGKSFFMVKYSFKFKNIA